MSNYWFDIAHYWATTAHLNDEEDLAYRRLLDLYYESEKPISCDMMSVSVEISVYPCIIKKILNEFFVRKDDGWHRSHEDQTRERLIGGGR